MTKKIVNGEIVELTSEEETIHENLMAQTKIENDNLIQAEEDYITLKASAKAKLIAGEALTEEEADTIVL